MGQSTHPAGEAKESALFRAWAMFLLRHRWLFLVATFAITGLLGWQLKSIKVDMSTEAFLSTDSVAYQTLEDLRDDFGRDDVFLVLAEGDVFSVDYLQRIRGLHDALAKLDLPLKTLGQRKRQRRAEEAGDEAAPKQTASEQAARPTAANPDGFEDEGFEDEGDGFEDDGDGDDWADEAGGSVVEEVISLVNIRNTLWRDGGVRVEELLEIPPTQGEMGLLRARVLGDPTMVGQVVGKAGHHSVIIVRTDFMSELESDTVAGHIAALVEEHQADGFALSVAGNPSLNAAIKRLMLGDMYILLGLSNIVMLLLLFLLFRSVIGVFAPMTVVGLAAIWTVGVMAAVGAPVTMITNILPSFLFVVGLGASIHLQSVYRDLRKIGVDNEAAIIATLASTGKPVLFTTLTTAVGLLSFKFASLSAIQDMGIYGAIGVMFALVHTLVLLPIILTFNKKSLLGAKPVGAAKSRDLLDRFLTLCEGLSRPVFDATGAVLSQSARNRTLTLGLVLVAGAGAALSQLGVSHDPLVWLPDDLPVKVAIESLDAHIGGTNNLALLVEAPPGKSLRNREVLQRLAALERYIKTYDDAKWGTTLVGNATSVLDVVQESWRSFNIGRLPPSQAPDASSRFFRDPRGAPFYTIPESDRGVSDMLTLFENNGPAELKRLMTVDGRRAVMNLRVHWLDAWAYRPLTKHIKAGIAQEIGDFMTVEPTGAVFNLFTTVSLMVSDLLRSFSMAFVVITFMMIIVLGGTKLGLTAMVPNLIPILFVMGFMGIFGINIDGNNLLVASIGIGIAVDDTIHFLFQFKSHFRIHGRVESAIQHALKHSGRAIVSTSVVLIAGFGVYVASELTNIRRFGLLIGLTVVFALLVDLVLCPALLRLIYKDRPEALASDGVSA